MAAELLLTDIRSMAPVVAARLEDGGVHAPAFQQNELSQLSTPMHIEALALQGWGVIVPDTAAGMERLAWIRPLVEWRARQCGIAPEAVPVMRVAPGMTAQEARRWRVSYELSPDAKQPRYLLILGDLDEVPLALQQELMLVACVGRLCFTGEDGQPRRHDYEAYCAKLCAIESAPEAWSQEARLLLYAARDGTAASETGYMDLVRPCYYEATNDSRLAAASIQRFGRPDDHQWHTEASDPAARQTTLLYWAEAEHPSVLLSLTHGAGVDEPAEQRLRQGALVVAEAAGQRRMELLDASYFAGRRFLPRGFWLMSACFGAATPVDSAYKPWLERLAASGQYRGDPMGALAYLARERPFVARVPQTALASPDGPLGIVGHVDLAWTFGYQAASEGTSSRAEPSPYYDLLRAVVSGSRFGAALLETLVAKMATLGTELSATYGELEIQGAELATTSNSDTGRRAWTWMRYHDLGAYVLLGDPAARVPTSMARLALDTEDALIRALERPGSKPSTGAPASVPMSAAPASQPSTGAPAAPGGTSSTGASTHTPEQMQDAVLAWLRGQETPSQIAARLHVSKKTLERWVDAYKQAGLEAMRALSGGGTSS